MTTLNDGGPAFPVPVLADKDGNFISTHRWGEYMMDGGGGMSMRDWFAGQALAGLSARNPTPRDQHGTPYGAGDYATRSYQLADAMLAARTKKGTA